jgi:hypothetical protein
VEELPLTFRDVQQRGVSCNGYRPFRNIGNDMPLDAAQYPRNTKISFVLFLMKVS